MQLTGSLDAIEEIRKDNMLMRFFCRLLLGIGLISSSFVAQAALKCDFDGSSMVSTLFDFNELPNGINASAPVGSVLFTKEHSIPIWCAKNGAIGSSITSGKEDIYINRMNVVNLFGTNSGLALYITINGERSSARKAYPTGLNSNYLWLTGLSKDPATHFTLDVTLELVKTGPNNLLNVKNTVELFNIGNMFDGDMKFYMKNANKLVFTTQTCDVMGTGEYTETLPPLNISNVNDTGPVDGHTVDINVKLSCNSKLWSTQAIVMKLTGQDIPGAGSDGLFFFKNRTTGEQAQGIALQMLQGARGQPFTPVVVGQNFKVGNFEDGQSVVTIPLRAGYYVRDKKLSPGLLQSILVYQIDYQ